MSSLNRRTLVRLGLVATVSLGMAACFRPLYGPTSSGKNLADILASIDVEKMAVSYEQEELAHELRSELIYLLNGSGMPAPKAYKLKLSYSQASASPMIDAETGRATTTTLTGTVNYTLTDFDNKVISAQGRVQSMVTYERPSQRFASLRANRDAQKRLAKELARHVKTRLAAKLSGS
ncbi:LPS assembly lipoprotein LptE [Microvirga sp. W0021]|uniref:LPS assembly lipoprotein LptE n=1 Tax=Hohaiivirga grylli TaxID=3133970 RepID=A0ABV0BF52_9HYPH